MQKITALESKDPESLNRLPLCTSLAIPDVEDIYVKPRSVQHHVLSRNPVDTIQKTAARWLCWQTNQGRCGLRHGGHVQARHCCA
jgi:hypothetical protein